ncbi:MAG: 23S rRNA (adenine(2030)-N(6))-methyltransferase RlmJ [Alphaproteobacteria bacterium]|nr:23S rRNA (adenine(2030)-N(6))-methyltransferase RlmJ [Alphaproteobacteria bacterium]NCT05587.1 23S rRNA (adenine(2030)-N(6))-methyltransferase RlmJ [Alphaproteobacteria bacterium]
MLSYQHIYHAGNRADVQKHLWLITVLEYLLKKDKNFLWIDTHAGRGLYDLSSDEAQKIKEYESGIAQFWESMNEGDDLPPSIIKYRDLINALNTGESINTYPGSAFITAKMLRPKDKLYAHDLHKGEYPFLERSIGNYLCAEARFEDGFAALKSLIPHKTLKRGGVLIDPSYEIKADYAITANAIIQAHEKWPQGIYMVWYPILDKAYHHDLLEPLNALNLANEDFVIDEWHFGDVERGMKGTGIAIINPPFQAPESMAYVKKFLEQ